MEEESAAKEKPISPEVVISPTEPNRNRISRIKNRKSILIIIAILFIIIILASYFQFKISPFNKQGDEDQEIINKTTITNDNVNSPLKTSGVDIQVLVSEMPYFDDLKITDLPNIRDIRFVGEYGKNVIVGSHSRIVEYNPVTKKIVRTQDTRKFDCNHAFTIIGDFLYTACNASYSEGDGFISQGRSIYKIDLNTGKAIKRYSEKKILEIDDLDNQNQTDPSFVNVDLTSLAGVLWVSLQNGLMSIDPLTEEVKFTSNLDLGADRECHIWSIWGNKKLIWSIPNPGIRCGYVLVVLNNSTDELDYFTPSDLLNGENKNKEFRLRMIANSEDTFYLLMTNEDNYEDQFIAKYDPEKRSLEEIVKVNSFTEINNKLRNSYFPEAHFPQAYGGSDSIELEYINKANGGIEKVTFESRYDEISNFVKGTYYILGDDLYVLNEGINPKIYSQIKLPKDNPPEYYDNLFLTLDGRYLIARYFTSVSEMMGYGFGNIILFDLLDNSYTNLIENTEALDENILDTLDNFSEKFDYDQTTKEVYVENEEGKNIFKVNLLTKEIIFN